MTARLPIIRLALLAGVSLIALAAPVAFLANAPGALAQEDDVHDEVEPGADDQGASDPDDAGDSDASRKEENDDTAERDDNGSDDEQRTARAACAAKIVGGCESLKGAWPSMALMHPSNDANWVQCGGTIIDEYWVLTAAHCITSFQQENKVGQPTALKLTQANAGDILMREGHWRLKGGSADKGRVVKVAQVIPHPAYTVTQIPGNPHDQFAFTHDFALIRLAKPAKAPRQVLARKANVGWFTKPGTVATVVGFGHTAQDGQSSVNMMQVDVPIVTEQKCQTVYAMMDYAVRICAGLDEGGKDSCQGDSGGPLFARDGLKQPVQIGVVSYGKGCAQPNAWGVYSSVGAIEDWIRQNVPKAVFSDQAGDQSPGVTIPGLDEFIQGGPGGPTQVAQLTIDVVPGNQVKIGEVLAVRITSSVDGRLIVFNRDETGKVVQLFPNNFSKTTAAGLLSEIIKAGETVEIPGPDAGFLLRATPPAGINEIIAIVAPPDAKTSAITQAGKDLTPIANLGATISAIAAASHDAEQSRGVVVEAAPASGRAAGQRRYEIVP